MSFCQVWSLCGAGLSEIHKTDSVRCGLSAQEKRYTQVSRKLNENISPIASEGVFHGRGCILNIQVHRKISSQLVSQRWCNGDIIVAKNRKQFYFSQRLLKLILQHFSNCTKGYTSQCSIQIVLQPYCVKCLPCCALCCN